MTTEENLELAMWSIPDYDSIDNEEMCKEMADCLDGWAQIDGYLERDWAFAGFKKEMRGIFKKYGYFDGERSLENIIAALEVFVEDEAYS